MKKIISMTKIFSLGFFLLIGFTAASQVLDSDLNTQVDNTIKGKIYSNGAATDMHKAIIKAKASRHETVNSSGTNSYTAAHSGIDSYSLNLDVKVRFIAASTGASTLNINSFGAKKIFKDPTTQAGSGDLKQNQVYNLVYDTSLDTGAGGFLIVGSSAGGSGFILTDGELTTANGTGVDFGGSSSNNITATLNGGKKLNLESNGTGSEKTSVGIDYNQLTLKNISSSGTQEASITIDNSGVVVKDTYSQKGIHLAADYSATLSISDADYLAPIWLVANTVDVAKGDVLSTVEDNYAPLYWLANIQTGAYTLISGDEKKAVYSNSGSPVNITVPPGVFPLGAEIQIWRKGAVFTLVAGAGVTLETSSGTLASGDPNTALVLHQYATNVWSVANGSAGSGGVGSGTVTSVSVVTANGISGSVASSSTTPAITLTLGAITPTSVNGVVFSGSSTPTLSVTGSASISGANTGDQTNITGNSGSSTILQTARNINGVSFNGSSDITVPAAAGTLTGSTLAAGVTASSLTSVGTLTGGATGTGFTIAFGSSTITGDLPFSNITQGSALSVLGVTGNATADVASIAAGTDNQVLRRSGTTLAFGAVNLASSNAVTGILPMANIASGTPDGTKFVRDDGTLAVPGGGGTITSVGMTVPSFLSVSGSPVTNSGVFAVTLSGTALPVTSGGVGLNTATQGDLIYASAANTYSALAKNTTAQRVLTNGGTSNNPAWAQVDLTTGVTGVLPVANGGTGGTSGPWSLSGGGTITAANTITANTANFLNFGGTITTTATNQYHTLFNPSMTADANNRVVSAVKIAVSLSSGAFSGTDLRALDVSGGAVVFKGVSAIADRNFQLTDNANSSLVEVFNDGGFRWGNAGSRTVTGAGTSAGLAKTSGGFYIATIPADGGVYLNYAFSGTTGSPRAMQLGGSYTSASGTQNFIELNIIPALNSAAGSSSFTLIDGNPTLTSFSGPLYGVLMRPAVSLSGFGTGTPTSTLTVSGSIALGYVAKSANYTLTTLDHIVECTANSFTVTLPTAVGITGREYIIDNSGAGLITIATTSSQTIDGGVPGTVATGTKFRVYSNGANWRTY